MFDRISNARLQWYRERFAAFRQLIRPDMVWGWWIEQLTIELDEFYARMVPGERPKMAIMAPPQHGKSCTATDLICWVASNNPNLKQSLLRTRRVLVSKRIEAVSASGRGRLAARVSARLSWSVS